MGAIIETISETLVGMIQAVAQGLGNAVQTLVFTTGEGGTQELSNFAKFAFAIFGISLGITLVYYVVAWVRGN